MEGAMNQWGVGSDAFEIALNGRTVEKAAQRPAVSRLAILGKVRAALNGEVVDEGENLIVDTGTAWIVARMHTSSPPAGVAAVEVGTGSTAAAAGDTSLVSALTPRDTSPTVAIASNVMTITSDWAPGEATGMIREAGIFNANASGTLIARRVFSAAIDKQAGDTLQLTWTLTITAV